MRFISKPSLKLYATIITKSIKYSLCLSTMNMDMDGGSDNNWRGVPLSELYGSQSPWGAPEFRLVSPSHNHAVLYHVPSSGCVAADRPPKPQIGQDKWDSDHVRMPCSDQSLYPVVDNNGVSHLKKRWEMIENALSKPIRNSHELGNAILSYNTNFRNTWKFRGLHKLFDEYLEEEETQYFFDVTLPEVIKLALDLPKLVQAPIPLLKQHKNFSVSLSQQQIASLLANAFFCTFPRRNATKKTSEYASYPFINFNSSGLYESTNSDANLEKLKCICHYFRRIVTKVPVGTLTFSRRSVPPRDCPSWPKSTRPIGSIPLHVEPLSTIEDADSLIQIDFANKFLGGGSERYSKYVGYGYSFQFAGDHRDNTPRDSSGRRRCAVLAIDAVPYNSLAQEFRRDAITRELNKAWVGISFDTDSSSDRLQYPGVATGNWGCGAFGGTPHLKSLVQVMASAQARRPMAYYTFGDTQLRDDIANMYNLLARHNVTVVLKENNESSQNSSDNMMDTSVTESTPVTVVIEDELTDNSPDLFSQDEMDQSLLEATIQSERIANKTDIKPETTNMVKKPKTNTTQQVRTVQPTNHLTEQQIEQQITQQIDQQVDQHIEQKESSKSPPTADTKKMSLLDAVTIMEEDNKHEQHTSLASNKRFSLLSDTKPAMVSETESTPERKKSTPKKKITDYFSTRNK
ncbi:unnamed protein product [Spodoptera littoralis]|uniref:poly(ADP-ribose) glycohydrolase n=1 Tax=Spodoptera littoralis TaxID=7109 RepID=A0A9P0IFG6_SPOLI|nr:unnamed protein product [Spodoptera littoralis]CAH1646843.1 unnamed protein product [Spodoptera littoralis]